MSGETVTVPRKLLEDALNDLLSPFPREVQVAASLGFGDTSIERLKAALNPQEPGNER